MRLLLILAIPALLLSACGDAPPEGPVPAAPQTQVIANVYEITVSGME